MSAVIRKSKNGPMHTYDVFLEGVLVGTIRKRVVKYNLRRTITVTSWIPTTADGVRLSENGERTRAGAATRLVAAARAGA